MRKHFRKHLFAFVFSCLVALPAAAQELPPQYMMRLKPMPPVSSLVPVPAEMQQLWILRSCEKGEMSFRFSRRYLMASISQGSKLFRLGGLGALGNDRYTMTMPGEATGLMMSSDGKLIQYFGDLKISFSREALEARRIMIPHVQYLNCSEAEKTRINEDPVMRAMLPALDDLQEACPDPKDIAKKSCQKAIFAVFDKNKDGRLDTEELKAGSDILISRSPFSTCQPDASTLDTLSREGDDYIAWMMAHLDQDKDQAITFDEFVPQWQAMQSDPLMSGLTNLLIAADRQTGILPESIKPSCVNCCVAATLP